jgi:hypothetical protein
METPLIGITLGRVARASSDEPPFTDPPQFFLPTYFMNIFWKDKKYSPCGRAGDFHILRY